MVRVYCLLSTSMRRVAAYWLCGLSSVPPGTSGAKPGHFGVPKATFGIPGQSFPNRDCPGKTGTVGQLDHISNSLTFPSLTFIGLQNSQTIPGFPGLWEPCIIIWRLPVYSPGQLTGFSQEKSSLKWLFACTVRYYCGICGIAIPR